MEFGLQQGFIGPSTPQATIEGWFAKMAGAGATRVRLDLAHDVFQAADPARWYFTHPDRLVSAAQAKGLAPLITVRGSAACNRPPGRDVRYAAPFDPTWRDRHALYLAEVARRYPGVPLELWNEPNNAASWPTTSPLTALGDYAEYVTFALGVIRDVDPDATVITGGLSPGVLPHEPGTVGADAPIIWGYFLAATLESRDVRPSGFGLHPYWAGHRDPAEVAPWNVLAYQTPALRKLLDALGWQGVPIWATECGERTDLPGGSEVRQADHIAEAFGLWGTFGEGPLFLYRLQDDTHDGYGVLHSDGMPKLAYARLQQR